MRPPTTATTCPRSLCIENSQLCRIGSPLSRPSAVGPYCRQESLRTRSGLNFSPSPLCHMPHPQSTVSHAPSARDCRPASSPSLLRRVAPSMCCWPPTRSRSQRPLRRPPRLPRPQRPLGGAHQSPASDPTPPVQHLRGRHPRRYQGPAADSEANIGEHHPGEVFQYTCRCGCMRPQHADRPLPFSTCPEQEPHALWHCPKLYPPPRRGGHGPREDACVWRLRGLLAALGDASLRNSARFRIAGGGRLRFDFQPALKLLTFCAVLENFFWLSGPNKIMGNEPFQRNPVGQHASAGNRCRNRRLLSERRPVSSATAKLAVEGLLALEGLLGSCRCGLRTLRRHKSVGTFPVAKEGGTLGAAY